MACPRHHGSGSIHSVGLDGYCLLDLTRVVGDELLGITTVVTSLALVGHLAIAILLSLDIALSTVGRVGLV